MNLALPAIFLFALLLPGAIFRHRYQKGNWTAPLIQRSLAQRITEGFIAAVLLHALWITLGGLWYDLDFQIAYELLNLSSKATSSAETIERFHESIGGIFIYFGTLYGGAFALGVTAHTVVRKLRLDVVFSLFQFNNPWYYLLYEGLEAGNGISVFTALRHPRETFDVWRQLWSERDATVFTVVQATIDQGGETFIYQGILNLFFFKEGSEQLDRLVLGHVARRRLTDDREPSAGDADDSYLDDERWYNIEADYFVLRFDEVTDLGLMVYKEESVTSDPSASAS